jgi:class 3 adenylate cyclase/tetratricopeptide (TPR) repeat protein
MLPEPVFSSQEPYGMLEPSGVRCPRCQAKNADGARFCEHCGARLEKACPSCGAPATAGRRFCRLCGASLDPESRRFGAPQSYTPQHLAQKILTSKSALEGERKHVTVLFADLKGSMELLADRDPEEARTILDPVLERMMEAVHRYEGTVNQVMGDGIMALFGAPIAHEDHAVRACYAALRMQDSVKRYAGEMRRTAKVPLAIRVGLNSGEVVVRSIGGDLHMDYTAVGQTTHLAARMEQAAVPGTSRLTSATLRLAEGLIEVRPLGPTTIRGLVDSLEAFELVGVGPNRTRLEAGANRGLTPLVGRDAEVALLHEVVERAERGQGEVVALVGEPGVGKSRLVWELTRSPRIRDWLALTGRAESYSTSTPYLPLVELLKGYFRVEPSDDTQTVPEKVMAKLTALDQALSPTHIPLLALLDVPVDDLEWQTLDPSVRRRRTLEAVQRLLIRESHRQPLLLVFEDLHWLDPETQAFLNSFIEVLPDLRVLLVVSYRPQYRHQWANAPCYRHLRIGPLPSSTAEALLRSLLGHDPSLQTLIPLLIERTDGNPFFLEETVRTFIDNGVLGGDVGARHVARALHDVQLPATVEAVVAARIDALSLDDKHLLQAASVIGRDVPTSLLSAIAERSAAELRQGITRLQAAEFLYETRRFPDPEYTFKHALSHEVAYRSLLKDRRRALHARIVEAIETLYAERLAERVDQLGSHALHGEVWDKAVHYLQQAGAKAFDRSANRQAVAYYEAALSALGRLPDSRDTVARAIDLRFDLRNALHALGEFGRVVGYLREAEALARQLGDQRRLGWVLGYQTHFFTMRGDYDRAVEAGRHALAIADTVDELGVTVVANAYLGLAYLAQGDYRRASEFHRKTMVSAAGTASRDRAGLVGLAAAYAGGFLAWSLAELGRFVDAIAWGREAIRVADGAKHPYTQIVAEAGVGYLHRRQGNFDQAISLLEHSMNLCQATDTRVLVPFVASLLGSSYAFSHRLSEALPLLEQAVESAVSIRLAVARPLPVGLLGEAYLMAGRLDQALEEAQRAFDLSCKHRERGFEGWAWQLLGEIHSRRRAADAATESYDRALAIAEELGMRPLVAHCHLGLGKLYWRTGKREQAQEHLTTAATMCREMDMRFWLEQAGTEMKELA